MAVLENSAVSDNAQAAAVKPAAAAPDDIVRAATIDFPFWTRIWRRYWQRRWLRFWAWYTKRTRAGERWLIFNGDSHHHEFNAYFNENAYRFGDELHKHFPNDLRRRLEGFTEDGGEPFLIVKGVFSRRLPQKSFAKALERDPANPLRKIVGKNAEKLLGEHRINLIAAGLVAATGAELRYKQPGQKAYRDYITSVDMEKTQFVEGGDIPLYYRSATPEQIPSKTGGAGRAARINLFACIENPIADPVYLIRADDVVSRLTETERRLLSEDSYYFFDFWNLDKLAPGRINLVKHILYDGNTPDKPWLSFDPNRLWPSYDKTTAAHREALVALMASIQHVGAHNARKIVLQRGDALIVDNYRALICRRERQHFYFDPWPIGRPQLRWLRAYYGFPRL